MLKQVVLFVVAATLVAAALLWAACDDGEPITCGPCTVLRGTQCVNACGPGTHCSGATCVPDAADGDADGDSDGDADGDSDGDADGDADGDSDGDADGDSDGDADGDADGDSDSDADGDADGDADADGDGDADADTCSDPVTCAALSRAMLDAVNAARTGCGAMTWDDRLAAAAQECADAMAAAESFTAGTCSDLGGRLDTHGVTDYAYAGQVSAQNRTMSNAVTRWFEDADTAEYLNNCDFSVGGVGIGVEADGRTLWFNITMIEP